MILLLGHITDADRAYWAARPVDIQLGHTDATTDAVEHPQSAPAWIRLGNAGHGHDGLAVTA